MGQSKYRQPWWQNHHVTCQWAAILQGCSRQLQAKWLSQGELRIFKFNDEPGSNCELCLMIAAKLQGEELDESFGTYVPPGSFRRFRRHWISKKVDLTCLGVWSPIFGPSFGKWKRVKRLNLQWFSPELVLTVLFGVTKINFSMIKMWEKMINMEYIPPGFPARYFMLGGY